jgi:hypothetical protein
MRRLHWLPTAVLAPIILSGCGGTNTTDGAQAYNRSSTYAETPIAPGVSGYANEILAVSAFVNAAEIKEASGVSRVVAGLKRLPIIPKRVFLLGATATNAEWWKKPLEDAKISVVPVVGTSAEGWDKVVKNLGVAKILSNGPKDGGVNPDGLKATQASLSSQFVAEGVRFVIVNTDTPLKTDKPGSLPGLWLKGAVEAAKENTVVVGWRSLAALGEKDDTPVVADSGALGKATKVVAWVSSSAVAPLAKKVVDNGPISLAVGGGIGQDKLPHVGLLEIKKDGTLTARVAKLSDTSLPTTVLEAALWSPAPKATTPAAKPAQPIKK